MPRLKDSSSEGLITSTEPRSLVVRLTPAVHHEPAPAKKMVSLLAPRSLVTTPQENQPPQNKYISSNACMAKPHSVTVSKDTSLTQILVTPKETIVNAQEVEISGEATSAKPVTEERPKVNWRKHKYGRKCVAAGCEHTAAQNACRFHKLPARIYRQVSGLLFFIYNSMVKIFIPTIPRGTHY